MGTLSKNPSFTQIAIYHNTDSKKTNTALNRGGFKAVCHLRFRVGTTLIGCSPALPTTLIPYVLQSY